MSAMASNSKKTSLNSNEKRILKDVIKINKNPLTDQGIYYKHDDNDLFKGYAMIIGPDDTIYKYGCYFFTFNFTKKYPFEPPKVEYYTNGNNVRFNPNLYRNGKVCISILNTWAGPQWTSCQTISSILLSLITLFHNKPLLNEPGFSEKHKDFKNYNSIIEYSNFEIAIKRSLLNAFHHCVYFDIEIKEHFKKNKKNVLDAVKVLKNKQNKRKKDVDIITTSIYGMKAIINYTELYDSLEKLLN
tara:strand:- start:507 stop:1238 length:732 start_codon:yes stop_codon:yes gene_type:complete